MSVDALAFCLQVAQAQARLTLKLDDVLGTWHGISLDDLRLLEGISQAGDAGAALTDLERPLGLPSSGVLRRLLPLEKTGLVERDAPAARAGRRVRLRPAGRQMLADAGATARSTCEKLVAGLPATLLEPAASALEAIARSRALDLK